MKIGSLSRSSPGLIRRPVRDDPRKKGHSERTDRAVDDPGSSLTQAHAGLGVLVLGGKGHPGPGDVGVALGLAERQDDPAQAPSSIIAPAV